MKMKKANLKSILKFKFNKKVAILVLVGILFAGAVYLNWALNKSKPDPNSLKPNAEDTFSGDEGNAGEEADNENPAMGYFEAFRRDRDDVRAREIEYIDEVIATSASDAETLRDAQEKKLALVENMEKEFIIENLVKAKGFNDVAVTFQSGKVNVIVDKEVLESAEVAQILDIVIRETGKGANDVRIIPGSS